MCGEDIIKGPVHAEEGARGTKPGFPGSKHWNNPPALGWESLRWTRERQDWESRRADPSSRSQLPSPKRPELR